MLTAARVDQPRITIKAGWVMITAHPRLEARALQQVALCRLAFHRMKQLEDSPGDERMKQQEAYFTPPVVGRSGGGSGVWRDAITFYYVLLPCSSTR